MSKPSAAVDPADPVLGHVRSVTGRRFLGGIAALLVAVFFLNLIAARHNRSVERTHLREAAIVRDPEVVAQEWEPAANGMILRLRSIDRTDSQLVALIRRSSKWQRAEYLRADYSGGTVGGKDVPGRSTLEFGTSHDALNCEFSEIEGGAQLRWTTTDPVMLDALREWAAAIGEPRPSWATPA